MSALRVGVFGLRRGLTLAGVLRGVGASVVAVADSVSTRRELAAAVLHPVTVYEQFDDLLAHDLDAIVVANHFDEHARFAIAALTAGRHVLSETAACRTPAEAVALQRAVAESSAQYMLGENYPYLPNAQTLRRMYTSGVLGEVEYAESEYLHSLAPTETGHVWAGDTSTHWRAQIACTAYCTHSVAPPLFITGRRPVSVIALPIPGATDDPSQRSARRAQYPAALLAVTLDNGAVLRSLHGFLQGEQMSCLRVHGSRALAESRHGDESGAIRLRLEAWASPSGTIADSVITEGSLPSGSDPFVAADVAMCREFVAAATAGRRPEIDVDLGVDATLVGIYGLRSLLAGSVPVAIPDLRDEGERHAVESDHTDGLRA